MELRGFNRSSHLLIFYLKKIQNLENNCPGSALINPKFNVNGGTEYSLSDSWLFRMEEQFICIVRVNVCCNSKKR